MTLIQRTGEPRLRQNSLQVGRLVVDISPRVLCRLRSQFCKVLPPFRPTRLNGGNGRITAITPWGHDLALRSKHRRGSDKKVIGFSFESFFCIKENTPTHIISTASIIHPFATATLEGASIGDLQGACLGRLMNKRWQVQAPEDGRVHWPSACHHHRHTPGTLAESTPIERRLMSRLAGRTEVVGDLFGAAITWISAPRAAV